MILVAAVSMTVASCGNGSDQKVLDLEADIADLQTQIEQLATERDQTVAELEATESSLAEAVVARDAAAGDTEQLTRDVDRLQRTVDARDTELVEVEQLLGEQNDLLAQLMLAFDDDIAASRTAILETVPTVACTVGSSYADGDRPFTRDQVIAVIATQVTEGAASDPATTAVLELSDSLWDFVDVDTVETTARSCYDSRVAEVETLVNQGREAAWAYLDTVMCGYGRDLAQAEVDEAADDDFRTPDDEFGSSGFSRPNATRVAETSLADNPDADAIYTRLGSFEAMYEGHPASSLHTQVFYDAAKRCFDEVASAFPKWDGTYDVGATIRPGTWTSEGNINNCYWARLRADGSIIDNSFVTSARRMTVVIRSSDALFETDDCGTWFYQG